MSVLRLVAILLLAAVEAGAQTRLAKQEDVAALQSSTSSLGAGLGAETAARLAQDEAIAVSTNSLQDNIDAEAAARIAKDNEIAVATTSLASGGTPPNTLESSTTIKASLLISNGGHFVSSGTAPTILNCGTGATVVGNDIAGRVTWGTGAPGNCTIIFHTPFAAPPVCVANTSGVTFPPMMVTSAPTATQVGLDIDPSYGGNPGDKFWYICIGLGN
jgi:hypothetical protein